MKKLFKLLSVLLLAVSLVGCTASTEPKSPEDVEITIYLVRHGKTWFNQLDLVQGFADSPLIEKGINQAKLVGKNMADIEFVAAYSSSLGRQRETLQYILEGNKKGVEHVKELDGFKEWNYGGFEGLPGETMWTAVLAEHGYTFDPEYTQNYVMHDEIGDKGISDTIAAIDETGMAENYDEITARAQATFDTIVEEVTAMGGGNVLAVSSGGQIPTILELLVPGQYNGEYIDNCTVTILKYKNGVYTLEVAGDYSYLAE